jgi:carbon-monoxide dehydrogenase medium subunit
MHRFEYYQPKTLEEAFGLMEKRKNEAEYVAGGTDVIVGIKQRVRRPKVLISLRGVEGLGFIRDNGAMTIGSMTLFRDLERHDGIRQGFPALYRAVSLLANPQIRNVATIGGNLCNAAPSADCAPPLLVMEAVVTLKGPGGKRAVPVDEFFSGPGENVMEDPEILTEISIPGTARDARTAFVKKGRLKQDIAVVNAAALLVMDGAVCRTCRLAAGAVSPVPMRLWKAEEMVEGKPIDEELLERVKGVVEESVQPITDVRSTEEYRRTMSGVLIKRAIQKALEDNE